MEKYWKQIRIKEKSTRKKFFLKFKKKNKMK